MTNKSRSTPKSPPKLSLGLVLTLLLIAAVSYWLNAGDQTADEGGKADARSWPVPSAAEIQRFKAEPGMKASASELKKLASATVVRVVDGDTVELTIANKKEKVRLLNINTPETVDPRKGVEEYGKEASDFAKSVLSPGSKVYYKHDVEKADRYGRLLLHIYLEDGVWFNALMIRAGYAQVMTVSPNVAAADFFKQLQRQARAENVGLWQVPEYRK